MVKAKKHPMKKMSKKVSRMAKLMGMKVGKVVGEYKSGALHSGSKKGPMVTNPKQAVAIGLSEAKKLKKGKF